MSEPTTVAEVLNRTPQPQATFRPYGFRRSESIGKLAGAMAKAQGMMKAAIKDAENPYYHSHYADLASVIEVVRVPLSSNEISWFQFPRTVEIVTGKDRQIWVEVETMLCHVSGEWISETLALPVATETAQGIGSAETYARRYSLGSICGVASEEDDGAESADPKKLSAANSLRNSSLAILTTAAGQGLKALAEAWKSLTPAARKACEGDEGRLKAIKEIAKNAGTAGLKGHGGNKPEPTNPVMELQDHILVECGCGWEHFKVAAVGSFWPEGTNAHSFVDVPPDLAMRILRDKEGLKRKVQLVRDKTKNV